MPDGRSILLVKLLETDDDGAESAAGPPVLNMMSLGSIGEITEQLAQFNTAPDGAADTRNVLHGPGIVVQLPMVGPQDPVQQLLVTMNEESTAWPVLIRICRMLGWKMMDPQSGRTFG